MKKKTNWNVAMEKAAIKEFHLRHKHFMRVYGVNRALDMTGAVARVMVALEKARNPMEVQNMIVDIFNAVSAMNTIAQTYRE